MGQELWSGVSVGPALTSYMAQVAKYIGLGSASCQTTCFIVFWGLFFFFFDYFLFGSLAEQVCVSLQSTAQVYP